MKLNRGDVVVYLDVRGRKQVAMIDNLDVELKGHTLVVDGYEPAQWNFAEDVTLYDNAKPAYGAYNEA